MFRSVVVVASSILSRTSYIFPSKDFLFAKYAKLAREKEESMHLRESLERELLNMSISDAEKELYRERYKEAEDDARRDLKKRLTINDFESLNIIGRGAFGEVRLVRMKNRHTQEIYAMKSMLKEAMITKNQVSHIRAERDILTESENPWIVTLFYSFQVKLQRCLLLHSLHLAYFLANI